MVIPGLAQILSRHKSFLYEKPDGVRVDLSGQDLSSLDLESISLCNVVAAAANFSRSLLTHADLSDADLIPGQFRILQPEQRQFRAF